MNSIAIIFHRRWKVTISLGQFIDINAYLHRLLMIRFDLFLHFQVVKEMWNYIRNHDLQDPTNKRVINCDAALREVFGCDSTDMFQMNKLLSTHVFTLPNADGQP